MVLLKARCNEWFDLRNKVITGSDIAGLFALNPSISVPKLVRIKSQLQKDDKEDNPMLRTGRMMENVCIASVHEMGYDVSKAADDGMVNFITHKHIQLGSSLDALLDSSPAECKSTELETKFDKWLKEGPPSHYILQIYVQLMCLDKEHGFLIGCLSKPPFPTLLFRIIRSPKVDKIISNTVSRFWENFKNKEKFKINQNDKKDLLTILPKLVTLIDSSWLLKKDELDLDGIF